MRNCSFVSQTGVLKAVHFVYFKFLIRVVAELLVLMLLVKSWGHIEPLSLLAVSLILNLSRPSEAGVYDPFL
jgi:hypothetical protein